MKRHNFCNVLTLAFAFIVLSSRLFSHSAVQSVHCLSAQTGFSSCPKMKLQPENGLGFPGEVCRWLDRQPDVSYREIELPPIILTTFSTIPKMGNKFVELERKSKGFQSNNSTEIRNPILLHLIPTPSRSEECLPPKFQKDLTDYFNQHNGEDLGFSTHRKEYSKIIHLHEDIWNTKRDIVYHRLMAQLGLGVYIGSAIQGESNERSGRSDIRRIFARKTTVRRMQSPVAMQFLDEHHLWGATKAKHNYGLFTVNNNKKQNKDLNKEELVAVATFSSRRKIVRSGKPHQSHELLRFCSKRDSNVVGGISKLIKAFVREKKPDDIVTVVDRDWGDGSGWYSLGFHTVATMNPIVMVVCASNTDDGFIHTTRRHLVGAGIRTFDTTESKFNRTGDTCISAKKIDRIGLSTDVLEKLNRVDSVEEVLQTLSEYNYFPIYDTGVERMMKIVSYDPNGNQIIASKSNVVEMWQNSQPTYAKEYYSPNLGIATLLNHTSMLPSALPLLIDGKSLDICV